MPVHLLTLIIFHRKYSTVHKVQYSTQSTVQYTKYSTIHKVQYNTQSTVQYTKYSTIHKVQYNTQSTVQYTKYSTIHKVQYSTQSTVQYTKSLTMQPPLSSSQFIPLMSKYSALRRSSLQFDHQVSYPHKTSKIISIPAFTKSRREDKRFCADRQQSGFNLQIKLSCFSRF